MGILAENTGKPYDEVETQFDRDTWMDPMDAKIFGLIDDIHEFSARGEDD